MEKKIDLRIIKTNKILYETLLNLLKEKPFEEIKVSDICEKSLINRSTFYAHYNDKYELLASYISDMKQELTEELSKNTNISNSKEYYLEMINLFFTNIEHKKEVYASIMINNRNSITMDMLYNALNDDIMKHLENDDTFNMEIPTEIIAKFYIGAVFNVAIEWIKSNKYLKKDIIKYLQELIPENLYNNKIISKI